MTLEEDIGFWERAAMKAERAESTLLYLGIAMGLKIARDDHLAASRAASPEEKPSDPSS